MKKILILGIALLAFGIFSCKKNYVCECKTFENGVINGNKNSNVTFSDMKKQEAINECNKMDTTSISVQEVTTLTQCEIK